MIFEVAFSIELTITLVFWVIIFPAAAGMNPEDLGFVVDTRYIVMTINMHGGIFLILWMELIVNRMRFKRNDFLFVLLFAGCYGIINFSYTFLKEPVY